jgi:hypothetical protein
MAQVDLASENAETGTRLSGQGWMVGPYVSAELAEGLFFSARGAWGQSSNAALVDVYADGSPLFEGRFGTERWLARATLHGRFDLGERLTLLPEIDLGWFGESYNGYLVSDGTSDVAVSGGTTDILRLQLASTLQTPIPATDGKVVAFLRPAVMFDRVTLASGSTEAVHGSVEVGLRSNGTSGLQGLASLRHDGIGNADYEAWSLRAMLMLRF